jgi:very-short-patch-repair endonuclease
VIPELMIAFEYDGSYWHQDKEKDEKRQREIEELGWRFIRYMDVVPLKEQIIEDIDSIILYGRKITTDEDIKTK